MAILPKELPLARQFRLKQCLKMRSLATIKVQAKIFLNGKLFYKLFFIPIFKLKKVVNSEQLFLYN
jgi:hypothetical protein